MFDSVIFSALLCKGGFIFQVLHRVTSQKDSCEDEETIFPITWFPFQPAHASSATNRFEYNLLATLTKSHQKYGGRCDRHNCVRAATSFRQI